MQHDEEVEVGVQIQFAKENVLPFLSIKIWNKKKKKEEEKVKRIL